MESKKTSPQKLKITQTNENENTIKFIRCIFRGEFLVALPILKKKEIFQSCNLTLHLKKLRKVNQTKLKEAKENDKIRD